MSDYVNNSPDYSYEGMKPKTASEPDDGLELPQVLIPYSWDVVPGQTVKPSDIVWNGVSSSEYGVTLLSPPTFVAAKERYSSIKIPGRSGNLTISEGENVRDNITLQCTCMISDPSKIPSIASWLTGVGKVSFRTRPEGYYSARVSNQISFDKLLRGNTHRTFTVMFDCEPYFKLYDGDEKYLFDILNDYSFIFGDGQSGGAMKTRDGYAIKIFNPGNAFSEPMLRLTLYQTNPVAIPSDCTLTIRKPDLSIFTSTTILYDGIYNTNGHRKAVHMYIDSEIKMARSTTKKNMSSAVRGDWPLFPATKYCYLIFDTPFAYWLQIQPRWRCVA